jgi:hypothetical protein
MDSAEVIAASAVYQCSTEEDADMAIMDTLAEMMGVEKFDDEAAALKAVKDKIRVSHPRYFNQVQLYMGEMGLPRCLFTILNADTMEMHHELISYEQPTHQAMVDRAARILAAMDSGEMILRGFRDSAAFECRYCDFAITCWENKA